MAHLHYFHAVVIALQKELQMHPDLSRSLQKQAHTFEEALAMIATYCDILVDGDYNAVDIMDMLHRALQRKRMPILFSERAPDELIGISAILGPDGKIMPKGGIIAGKTPEEHKEVVYDLQKTLHMDLPPEKKGKGD